MIVEYKILLGICIWLILGLISVIVYIVDCYKNTNVIFKKTVTDTETKKGN